MTLNLEPDRSAIFLDFDGTLVEIAPTPDAVVVDGRLPPLLGALAARLGGALAVISGRRILDIDRFLMPAMLPASGVHGLEWRPDPRRPVERHPRTPGLDVVVETVAARNLRGRGLLVEDKGVSVALHYRQAPELEDEVKDVAAGLVAAHADLDLLQGKMVVEVKPAAASKGAALERFMRLPAFSGRRPVFVGDDVTDEVGMAAAEAMGGFGVKVGEGDSRAAHRLADVAAVQGWLRRLMAA